MLEFPRNVPEDSYSYLECKRQGFEFGFATSAKVLFRSPADFRDHMKQSTRFKDSPKKLKKYFPSPVVDLAFSIPKEIIIKQLIIETLQKPMLMTGYIFINSYITWKKRKAEVNHVAYDPSISTKSLGVKI